MKQIKGNATIVDDFLKEVKKHGTDGFPFAAYLDDFSDFHNGFICWHWHDEVQITLIVEGEFTCQIGSEKITMGPGESIFINSGAFHEICPCKKMTGKLYSFIWRADMLAGNVTCDVYTECIKELVDSDYKYYFFDKNNTICKQLQAALLRIAFLVSEKPLYYQLRVYNQLSKIWLDICDQIRLSGEKNNTLSHATYMHRMKDKERLRNALQYMQTHYNENISLDEIAKAAMTSRSELCKSFKRTLDTSPKEFLLKYRIRQSMILLEDISFRISDIAEMTGFSSPSHFGACFQKYVGCTPLQYRKNI